MYNRENNSSLPFEVQMRLTDIYDGKNRRVNMDKKTLEVMDKFLLNDRRMLFSSCPIRYTTDIPYISKTLSNLSQTLKPIEKMKSDFIPKAFKKKFTLEKIKEKKATKEAMQKNIVKFKMLQMDPLERKKYLDKLKEKKKKLLESQLRHAEITKDQRSTEQTLIPPLKKEDLEFKCSNAKTQKVYKKLKELNEEFSYVTYMKESKMLSPNIEEYKMHKSSKSINYPMRDRKQITQNQAIHHDTASISTSQQQITAESENSPEHKIHKRIKRIFFTKRATPPRADPLRASVKNEVREFRASHRVDEILKGDKSKLKDLAALIDNNTIDFKKTYLVGTAKRGKTRHGGYISKDYDYNHNHSPHLSPSTSHYSYTTPSSPKPPRSARQQRTHTNTNTNINTRSSVPLQDAKSSPKSSPKTSPMAKKHILEHSSAMVSPFYKYETNVPNTSQTPRLLQRGLGNYASTPNVRIHGSKSTQKRIIRGKNVNIYKRSSPKNSINKQISGFEKGGKTSSSGVLLQGNNMKVAYSPLCKSNSKESVQNIFHLTTNNLGKDVNEFLKKNRLEGGVLNSDDLFKELEFMEQTLNSSDRGVLESRSEQPVGSYFTDNRQFKDNIFTVPTPLTNGRSSLNNILTSYEEDLTDVQSGLQHLKRRLAKVPITDIYEGDSLMSDDTKPQSPSINIFNKMFI